MDTIVKLKRWETTFERLPRAKQFQFISMVLVASFLVSGGIATVASFWQKRQIERLVTEIKALEYERMEERVDVLRARYYAQ